MALYVANFVVTLVHMFHDSGQPVSRWVVVDFIDSNRDRLATDLFDAKCRFVYVDERPGSVVFFVVYALLVDLETKFY